MDFSYWVVTSLEDGKGVSHMWFETDLTLNGVLDNSTVYWCALALKIEGLRTSYSCGLCQHKLNMTLDKDPNSDITAIKNNWNLTDVYFTRSPFVNNSTVF